MNVENTRDDRMEADVIEGPIECITEMEVEIALKCNETWWAPGPTGISNEMFLVAGCKRKKLLVDIYNLIITEGRMPSDWELSILVPVSMVKAIHCSVAHIEALSCLSMAWKSWKGYCREGYDIVTIDELQMGLMSGK